MPLQRKYYKIWEAFVKDSQEEDNVRYTYWVAINNYGYPMAMYLALTGSEFHIKNNIYYAWLLYSDGLFDRESIESRYRRF